MRISVYITSYNKSAYIQEAIESVLHQSLKPHEIIIIDDNSTDGSQDIISSIAKENSTLIKPVFNEQNMGVSNCRNMALERISGDIFTFLDGDDYFLPNKLADEYDCLKQNPECKAVYSNFFYEDKSGNKTGEFAAKSDSPAKGKILINTLKRDYKVSSRNNFIYEMMDTESARQVGGYDPVLRIWEDWDFRIRFSNLFKVTYNPTICSVYRKIPQSLSRSNPLDHLKNQKIVLKKNFQMIESFDNVTRSQVLNSINRKHERLLRISVKEYYDIKKIIFFIFYSLKLCIQFGSKRNLRFIIKEVF